MSDTLERHLSLVDARKRIDGSRKDESLVTEKSSRKKKGTKTGGFAVAKYELQNMRNKVQMAVVMLSGVDSTVKKKSKRKLKKHLKDLASKK